MGSGSDRDSCYAEVAVQMFQEDPTAAAARIASEVQDVRIRDFIWLTITREAAPTTMTYCKRIHTAAIAERCNMLVHRPHLRRALHADRTDTP